jgi:hypothetical protein
VTFVPSSSVGGGGAGGNVTVTNFPATQTVDFAQPVDVDVLDFPAVQDVDVQNVPAVQDVDVLNFPVTYPVTQGTDPWIVDGSAVTQPVSVDELPLPDGAATEETLSDVALTAILERDTLAVE